MLFLLVYLNFIIWGKQISYLLFVISLLVIIGFIELISIFFYFMLFIHIHKANIIVHFSKIVIWKKIHLFFSS